MQSYLFLMIIAAVGFVSKNKILFYSALTLIVLKLIPSSENILPQYKTFLLKFGIFIITVAILIPILMGEIGFKELLITVKSTEGIIALSVGVFAAYIATKGIEMQSLEPQIVVFVSLGIVLGVMTGVGSPVGPIVASGLTYLVLKIFGK